ncbi:hypothetical protein LEP3755_45640 [Leptolyngbya sp. NIES-3755]|nr:hypothetical protein LEP3755_45640 [Leptolyngbya sp. NIES-3755]
MSLSLVSAYIRYREWAYDEQNDSLLKRWRSQRFLKFLQLVNPPNSARILDLGGSSYTWKMVPHNFHVTIVNLDETEMEPATEQFSFVQGDATNLRHQFADRSFDVVFSNSVIEHVGDESQQAAFASEVQRIAKGYWIQTPSDRFPIEIHTGIPFYWNLPTAVQTRLRKHWRKTYPEWTDMIEETRVLSRQRMQALFPDAEMFTERKLLLEKSYAVYRPYQF